MSAISTTSGAAPSEEKKNIQQVQHDGMREIQLQNAHDAEDNDNSRRHEIPLGDYHTMNLERLVKEFKHLLHTEKVQNIKEHTEAIKSEFERKFAEVLEEKKEAFLEDGGQEMDFKYVSPVRDEFYRLYGEYREKRNRYYKEIEQKLQANLAQRQDIVNEIKQLIVTKPEHEKINVKELWERFNALKEQWRNAGPVPRQNYEDLWQNYNHHVDNFFDYIRMNDEFREMDFKHNLEEKLKIIEKAQALLHETDVNKAFRELQLLHRIWKEEIGPVSKEHREQIWETFSNISKAITDSRQHFLKDLEKSYEENMLQKNEILHQMKQLIEQERGTHKQWQKAMAQMEALREKFLSIGKVPYAYTEELWHKLREVSKKFNKQKNNFYKSLKKEQLENLNKKRELLKIANENKDSENWEETTPLMKKIQEDWKAVGHVPKKYSNALWKEFSQACNHYYDRLRQEIQGSKAQQSQQEQERKQKREEILLTLKAFTLSGDKEQDMRKLQQFVDDWNELGEGQRRSVASTKFNKIINALYKKLDFDKHQIEMLKYNTKLEHLASDSEESSLAKEQIFLRKKIAELENEILQLENNLLYFNNLDEKNPLMRSALENISQKREALSVWKEKLTELRSVINKKEA